MKVWFANDLSLISVDCKKYPTKVFYVHTWDNKLTMTTYDTNSTSGVKYILKYLFE